MTDNARLRQEGKPSYTMEDFRRITVADLKARLERIDNPMAREIAARLWKFVEIQFTNQYGMLMIKDSHKLVNLSGMYSRKVIAKLEELRGLDFGDIIAEGPDRLDEYLDSLHPFVRFLHPPARVKKPQDSADRLARYLDFYENPQQSVPESFRRSWLFAIGLFLSIAAPLLVVFMVAGKISNKPLLMIPTVLIFITGMVLSIVQLSGFSRTRMIALYISFTDEFMLLDGEAAESAESMD